MGREIKFRVWSEEDREYRTDCRLTELFTSETGAPATVYSDEGDRFDIEQYTGLKDKNGKEIYEGDIVNITAIVETDDSDMACIMDTNSVVCWDKEHARWDVNDKPESKDWDYRRRRYFVFVDSDDRENVEIIGNIHENPELLEAENE